MQHCNYNCEINRILNKRIHKHKDNSPENNNQKKINEVTQ